MYFILNYSNHMFYPCYDAETVESKISELERLGVQVQDLEIVLAIDPDNRLSVQEFLTYNW